MNVIESLDTIPTRPVSQIVRVPPVAVPVIMAGTPTLALAPATPPPSPQIAAPLVGTAAGFQFSFWQVSMPAGMTNVIAAYRVYRNSANVFSRNLVHTFVNDPTNVGAIVFTDTIVAAAGLSYYYWVTSVDTVGNESTPQPAQCGTVAGASGSTPYSNTGTFTYTSTTTTITWSWAAFSIYRADGTITNVANGSQLITGLIASTAYQFFPYYDEILKAIEWVGGGLGSPAIAFTVQTQATLAQENLKNRIPLSTASMMASTPGSGSGGGSGGGGGGGGGHKFL